MPFKFRGNLNVILLIHGHCMIMMLALPASCGVQLTLRLQLRQQQPQRLSAAGADHPGLWGRLAVTVQVSPSLAQ